MEDESIKLFSFPTPGYVPGIARDFSGGSQAYINVETLEVLAEGPLGVPLVLPVASASETPASGEVVTQEARGQAASTGFNFVASVSSGG